MNEKEPATLASHIRLRTIYHCFSLWFGDLMDRVYIWPIEEYDQNLELAATPLPQVINRIKNKKRPSLL
jgi:hypothetical protein